MHVIAFHFDKPKRVIFIHRQRQIYMYMIHMNKPLSYACWANGQTGRGELYPFTLPSLEVVLGNGKESFTHILPYGALVADKWILFRIKTNSHLHTK